MIYLITYGFIPRNKKTIKIIRRATLIFLALIILLIFSGCAGLDPLSQAAVDNDAEKIKTLINQGANVNEINKLRPHLYHTALCSAIDVRNQDAVKTLLELGADPNIYSSFYGINSSGYYRLIGSPLMEAVIEEDIIIVEMLLKAGANPNAVAKEATIDGSAPQDPLGYNATNGNLDITKLLLKYGANPNRKYPNESKAAYEALSRDYIDFVVLILENGLEIELDPQYAHYNAELAYIAADYYASSDEEKAIEFYKKAIELYPQGAKNYESIATGKALKEFGKMMLAAVGTAFNQYSASQGVNTSGSFIGSNYSYYRIYDYDPNWTEEEYFQAKAKQSVKNQTLCQEIVSCYEENNTDIKLSDCIEKSGGALKSGQK